MVPVSHFKTNSLDFYAPSWFVAMIGVEVPDGQLNGSLDESSCQYSKNIFSFTQEGCPVKL